MAIGGSMHDDIPARRRRTLWAIVAGVLAGAPWPFSPTSPAAAEPTDPRPTRVMPLGDSLTDGYNVPGGYRIELAARLAADDVAVDFVGSLSNGPATLRDREHEGHSGFRIDEISRPVGRWLRRSRPDIVLLMIGTNDVVQDHRLRAAPDRLSDLIDRIVATLPGTQVIVASIPQIGGSPNAERVVAYNADIPDIVMSKIDEGKDVTYVDINSVIEPSDLHTDYTHLNATGYCKVGDAWFVAIRSVLGLGPPPSPAPTSTPESCAIP